MIVQTIAGAGVTPYEVRIARGLLADPERHLADILARDRLAVVADATVFGHHGEAVGAALASGGISAPVVTVPSGEASKSFAGLEALLSRLLDLGLDRKDHILALGGGVTGDLAGLAAALYMRGIGVIQAPTTLLAQVDSSVGGKTAIDMAQGKNLVGAFHPPVRVLADLAMLDSLSDRQMRAGLAEMLKAGLLADAAYFDQLAEQAPALLAREAEPLAQSVARAVAIKAEIVAEDPTEQGRRALLNLGHTFGHALEAEAGFGDRLLHGEAVALGCVLAARLSVRLGRLDASVAERIAEVTRACGLPDRIEAIGRFDPDRLMARMRADKKAEAGRLTLILLNAIGQARRVADVDEAEVRAVLADAA